MSVQMTQTVQFSMNMTMLALDNRVVYPGRHATEPITLFDLAVDPPALWDEQRARIGL